MPSFLKALTAPTAVALVGASDSPGKLTARPFAFLRQHGFSGRIYPVNPRRDTVSGHKAYHSVEAIPDQIDHAYILVGTEHVISAVQDCARAGVQVVSVLADGFAEAGPEGQARQDNLVRCVKDAGMLLIGPNSTGVVDTRHGFSCTTNAAFRTEKLDKGRLAVISQSGSLIGTMVSRGQARGVAFSTLISAGNEAAAGVGELGSVLLEDPDIDGFALFMETIRDPQALRAFARNAHDAGKPIVAYMLGKSEEGRALAVSHTGALTGGAAAVDAFLTSAGIATVTQFDALIEAPAVLAKKAQLRDRPKTVTVVSTTGGGGAMVVDQLSVRGVDISGCSAASRRVLSAKDIPLGHGKLVDVTLAGTNYDTMKAVVSQLVSDPETGALVIAIGSSAQFNPELAVTPIVDAVAAAGKDAAPVFAFPIPHAEQSIGLLEAGGVPAFRTVEACADALSLLVNARAPVPLLNVSVPDQVRKLIHEAEPGVLNEVAAGAVFSALGIAGPRQLVLPVDAQNRETPGVTFPVVAKLISKDLPHKTELGAIQIGLGDVDALETAIAAMRQSVANKKPDAQIEGVLVQEMLDGLGEALIGLTRDPLVGPVVTVAAGGVMTEIYKDAVVRPAPVSIETAHEMIAEVKAFGLLRGYRGKPKGDLDALARAVVAVSQLADLERVNEAEINPILVRPEGEGVVLLDALIRVVPPPTT